MPTQPPNGLAADALTTLDQVKLWLGQDDLDPAQNDRLTWLINSASTAVMAFCQREFVSLVAPGTIRTFPLLSAGYIRFGGWDLQSTTLVQVDTDTASTPTTIPDTQCQLQPVTKPNGVYT